MAIKRDDKKVNLQQDGVIRDENENIRRDRGEALKDNYDRASAYEKDKIELRGIVFFGLGLVILILATFGLMYALDLGLESQAKADDKMSPMAMTKEERMRGLNLPPEPRLQGAPGFGVTEENGTRENLELREPQAEYRMLYRDWKKVWKDGRKDPQTGTQITIPMEEAKQKVLQQGLGKTRTPEQAQKALEESRQIYSYQSAGRATEIRRQ
jgi:hypothetical protein